MAMHLTPAEHNADPPEGWTVHKSGRRWQLRSIGGGVLDTFDTKTEAEAAKTGGRLFDLYQNEGRWFKGETVCGWKPYAECKPGMDKAAQALTPDSLKTFLLYAEDAGNWGGLPWVSHGNIEVTQAMRGNLADLVQKGLIVIHDYERDENYITFTDAGKALAAEHGISLE